MPKIDWSKMNVPGHTVVLCPSCNMHVLESAATLRFCRDFNQPYECTHCAQIHVERRL